MKREQFKSKIDIRKEYRGNKTFRFFVQLLVVMIGSVISGMAFRSFFKPYDIISSGFSGIAQLISKGIFGNYDYTTIVYIIINVILFLIALRIFGWKFVVFTLFGMVCYTLSMQYFIIPGLPSGSENLLLYSLIGGGLSGVGQGIAFRVGGSTGGSDIAAKIINRFFPKIKTGVAVLIINAIVILTTVIALPAGEGWQTALFAVVIAVTSTITCDMVLDGSKTVRAFYIICDKDEEISEKILERFHRGVTVIPAEGKFSHKDKKLLLCLVANTQAREMKEIVKDIDKNAFVFSTSVAETLGDGYFMREASIFKNKVKGAAFDAKQNLDCKAIKKRPKNTFGKRWKLIEVKSNQNVQEDTQTNQ